MFRRIFNKKRTQAKGQRDYRAPLAASNAQDEPTHTSPAPVDDSFAALARELSGLGQIEVSQAAKERGWATLQRELERHPVRPAVAPAKHWVQPARRWRWAIVSAAASVAVIAGVLGAYGAGAFQTAATVAQSGSSTTVTSVVSPSTTQSGTTVTTPGTTGLTQPSTTLPGLSTTENRPGTTQGTQSSTTQGPQPTSPSTKQPTTSTTQPGPTTTGEQQMAATEREGSARAAVTWLANLVITGNTTGESANVAPAARSHLAQMVMSLKQPYGYEIPSEELLAGDTVRVILVIQDRVDNAQGVAVQKNVSFVINVHVTAQGAVVTAINAGS